MDLRTRLEQKLSQTLVITPQLQQAIKLLLLSRTDYIEAIEAELLENPLLEKIDTKDDKSLENENVDNPWEGYLERFTDPLGVAPAKGLNTSKSNSFEEIASSPKTLEQELIDQIRLLKISSKDVFTALTFIVGNLDSRGYLEVDLDEIVADSGLEENSVLTAHKLLMSLDPAGVGARNLRECLLVQLDRNSAQNSLEYKIVDKYLELIEKRKFDLIAKKLQSTLTEIGEAIKKVNQLEPFPAREYESFGTRYIVPDVYVIKVGDDYQVLLNDDGVPKLKISSRYNSVVDSKYRSSSSSNSKKNNSKEYINSKFKSAKWLLKSIEQRQQTIYKVTKSIVGFQREFFDHGIKSLKPLVLKEVADDIEMHESTVSRITSNKYVHTPQGTLELKYFFTAGIKTAFGDVSSTAIKSRIQQLIQNEDKTKPISDQRIVDILNDESIDIARRTVAKYRESLKILPSSKRKSIL